MLDNFTPVQFKKTAKRLHDRHHGTQSTERKRHFLIEASGGITEDNIATYFSPGQLSNNVTRLTLD
jgi:nicotinate-nucleotide pyrophosphorylase